VVEWPSMDYTWDEDSVELNFTSGKTIVKISCKKINDDPKLSTQDVEIFLH
jgi:hypothetical protein